MRPFALLIATVAALLVLVAPAASAAECPSHTDAHGNSGQVGVCNVTGQGNGVGNTVNGVPVPGLPAIPGLPALPAIPGLPALPGAPGAPAVPQAPTAS